MSWYSRFMLAKDRAAAELDETYHPPIFPTEKCEHGVWRGQNELEGPAYHCSLCRLYETTIFWRQHANR